MSDERLDKSLDRLEELAENIRDIRQGEWLTTPCDALINTTIKSDHAPTMEVTLGWLCAPQLALEVDGPLHPFYQLSDYLMDNEQYRALDVVEHFLEDIWDDQLLTALPAEIYQWMCNTIETTVSEATVSDPAEYTILSYKDHIIQLKYQNDELRLVDVSESSSDLEIWRKGIIPFMNYQIRRKLQDAGCTGCGDVADDTGIAGDDAGGGMAGTSASGRDERGDYEMCDDDRINKLESRIAALEKMAGDLYGRTTKNKGAIEALTADEVRSEEKKTITVTKEDLEKYSGDFTMPAVGYCLGENMWLDDLNQQLMVIGKKPQSEQVQLFRIFFGGVGREATEVLLYTRGRELRICLPGETFLKTIDEVYKLLDSGKLCQKAYWKLLLDTLKSWEVR